MKNSTNVTGGRMSLLGHGIYHVLSLTKEINRFGYRVFPAKVRRWSNGFWINENVDLAKIFNKGSKGPLQIFQANTLVNQAIKITNMVQQTAVSGKIYYSYHWEINTEILEEGIQDATNSQNYQNGSIFYNEDPVDDVMTQEEMNKLNDFIDSVRKEESESQDEERPDNSITPDWIKETNDRIAASRKDNK